MKKVFILLLLLAPLSGALGQFKFANGTDSLIYLVDTSSISIMPINSSSSFRSSVVNARVATIVEVEDKSSDLLPPADKLFDENDSIRNLLKSDSNSLLQYDYHRLHEISVKATWNFICSLETNKDYVYKYDPTFLLYYTVGKTYALKSYSDTREILYPKNFKPYVSGSISEAIVQTINAHKFGSKTKQVK